MQRRFCRRRDKGVWERLLDVLIDEPDYEWLMIDASHCKVHPARGGRERRQSGHEPDKRGLNIKIHLAVDEHGMSLRVVITQGTAADCTQARRLIESITAAYLIADKGYDSDAIVDQAGSQGMKAVIPPRKNRTANKRSYDEDLYKLRHLIENAFLHLKRGRGIATRYAKNSASFLAAIQIRYIALWPASRDDTI